LSRRRGDLAEWHRAAAIHTDGLIKFIWNEAEGRPDCAVWRTYSGHLAGYCYMGGGGVPFIWDELYGAEYTGVAWKPGAVFRRRKFAWCPPERLRRIRDLQLALE
jgi:hypothetical protein